MKPQAHIAEWKKKEVLEVISAVQHYKVVGLADMTNMPSPQLQKLRQNLKDVKIIMTKARFMKIAFDSLQGKVTIKEDKVVVKEGEVISGPLAGMLTRLSIEPMEIGINLLATLENGVIYTKSVLFVDENAYLNNIKAASQQAFNLAFNIAYPTKENIKLLLQKAMRDADALAESRKIMTSNTVKKMISQAELEAKQVVTKMQGYDPAPLTTNKEGP